VMDHESLREAVAAQALDAIDPDDRASVEHELLEHLPGCEECLALFRAAREIAGDLALGAGAQDVSPELEARVLAAVRELPSPAQPRPSRNRTLALRIAAVAAVVAVLGSFTASAVIVSRSRATERRNTAMASVIEVLGDPSAKTAALHGAAGTLLAGVRADGTVVLLGDRIPDPQPGRVFELWLIHDGVPVPVDVFRVDGGVVALRHAVPAGDYSAVAVTSERSKVQTPSGQPIYQGPLKS
jgi:hypothetical protein